MKNKKLNVVLDGFLRSKIAKGMSEKEMLAFLESLTDRDDSMITEAGLLSITKLARNCEHNMRKFKIVVEDCVSLLITAYSNGLLDELVIPENRVANMKAKTIISDNKGNIDGGIEGMKNRLSPNQREQFEKMQREKEEGAKRLFTEKGMKSFIHFAEKEMGEIYCKIWEEVDFLGCSAEALLSFLKSTPEEIQEAMVSNDGKRKNVNDIPDSAPKNKEVLN